MKTWRDWMAKYMPGANQADAQLHLSPTRSSFLMHADAEEVRRQPDARERHAAGGQLHQKLRVPLLLPGITVSTSPTDFYPIQSVQLQRFKGETWELFGDIMSAEST